MTNGDYIRGMSNVILANIFSRFDDWTEESDTTIEDSFQYWLN